ncbi:MAG: histidine phosphatase family protein [Deltaproteobacteria bacterium]|nr:histidine phosphatase family protein [Deltaproteobacteria bacterium]MBI3065706.1 histidine phosphatase family protein [Deltaproteobacteria bacterium]
MQIVLVRHGATDWNLQGRCQGVTDRELSEVGVRQAEQLAALLRDESIEAVYSSALRRARQTAELISQPHNLPVMIEENIRELDHGALEGLTFNEIKQSYSEFLTRWRTEPAEIQVPGGERLIDVAERAWVGINRITGRHPTAESIVVVSHNFPILGIVCRVTGTHLNNYRSFHLDPCSITRLHRNGANAWSLTQVNNKEYPPQADSPL